MTCSTFSAIDPDEIASSSMVFHGGKHGTQRFLANAILCRNPECGQFELKAAIANARKPTTALEHTKTEDGVIVTEVTEVWSLVPSANVKPFPPYIPKFLLDDYREAAEIRDRSPKASATLSRRVLQGMIRDFFGIVKPRLVDEINALKGDPRVPNDLWNAIDALRGVGNIGAHMEQDVNIIVDVEPEEAEKLIGLVELLLKEWYIARQDRDEHLKGIVALAAAKKAAQKAPPAAP